MIPLFVAFLCTVQGPTWSERLEWGEGEGPTAREHSAFVLDAWRGRAVLLFGSGYVPYGTPLADAWAFDLATGGWTELGFAGDEIVSAGARRSAFGADGVFLHGGYGAGLAALGGLWHAELEEDHVWIEEVKQENAPPARMLHGFAHDPASKRFVVFGGASQEDVFAGTWIGEGGMGGVRWRKLEEAEGPGPRFGFAYAHDAARGRLLVCGGQIPPEGEDTGLATLRDLWALDFAAPEPRWSLLAEYGPDELPGRRNPAFTFDAATGDLLIWGGTGDGASALPHLYILESREPDAPVERVDQPKELPTRASGFGVVDPKTRRAWLGFGNSASGRFTDLVELKLESL